MQDTFLTQLHDANPIVSVASEYLPLKKSGKNYVCRCPFHSEKTPSCNFFPDTQTFYCFGCNTGGDVITFVEKIENLDFREAVEKLAKRAGLKIPENDKERKEARLRERIFEINREAANFFYSNLLRGEDKRGLEYFAKRKIKAETIKKYGLGFAPNSWDAAYNYLKHLGFSDYEILRADLCRKSRNGNLIDTFRNRVMFPITDVHGRVIAFGGRVMDDSKPKYLNSSDTPVFDKGKNCFSLGFAEKSSSKQLILCEGYMDVIAMNQAGFENAVATLGTSMTPAQARLLSRKAESVIISYDSDEAGQRATRRAINLLNEAGVRTKILKMTGAKDPDEYIKKYGADRFKKLINSSEDANLFEIERCFSGLDENNPQDKTIIIKRLVNVLSEMSDDIEREVYIDHVSKRINLPRDAIKANVDSEINKSGHVKSKAEWRNEKKEVIGLPLGNLANKSRRNKSREEKAEDEIIGILLKGTAFEKEIFSSLDENMFISDFNSKLFVMIKKESGDFNLQTLSNILSEDEMSEVSRLIHGYGEDIKKEEDIKELIEIIKSGSKKRKFNQDHTLTDDDLLSMTKIGKK